MEVHGYNINGDIEATIDGIRWTVKDDPSNRYRKAISAWQKQGNVSPDFVPIEPAAAYQIYKSTLVRRLSESEAVTLSAVLAAAPVKSKMLWDASEWLRSDDPLFADLKAAIGGALGATRATHILAREEA